MSFVAAADGQDGLADRNVTDVVYGGIVDGTTGDAALILDIVSVTTAALSVSLACLSFYFFVRMRRSFRQDVIMLLIQSDMMKAFWLMICPIVFLINPATQNEGPFCQVVGFFLTAAIEASDIAVLMIALHSALFIFRAQQTGGQGLYPYRRYAYAVWVVLPLILAAIVPITRAPFGLEGSYCYLPATPIWYRYALSWIPRYTIFGFIIVTYGLVYFYFIFHSRKLQEDQRRASTNSEFPSPNRSRWRGASRTLPPTPPIKYHGLLDVSPRRESTGQPRGREVSVASTVSTLKLEHNQVPPKPQRANRPATVSWNWLEMDYQNPPDAPPQGFEAGRAPADEVASPTDIVPPDGVSPAPRQPDAVYRPSVASSRPVDAERSQQPDQGVAKSNHKFSIRNVFLRSSADAAEATSEPLSAHLSQPAPEDALHQAREKTRRQLRLLIVYPVMYIITWIAPFVWNILRYDEAKPQPFSLQVASTASLCLSAAIDSIFFSVWEQPWRHLRGGFWEGLVERLGVCCHGNANSNMGRTREEQLRDARHALDRRNYENTEREAQAAMQRTRPARQPREWWDVIEEGREEYLAARAPGQADVSNQV